MSSNSKRTERRITDAPVELAATGRIDSNESAKTGKGMGLKYAVLVNGLSATRCYLASARENGEKTQEGEKVYTVLPFPAARKSTACSGGAAGQSGSSNFLPR